MKQKFLGKADVHEYNTYIFLKKRESAHSESPH